MKCYQRFGTEPVPNCLGEGVDKRDYCAYKTSNYLWYIGNREDPGILGECEGDCDNDSQCIGDMICFERTGFTPVPFCDGVGRYVFILHLFYIMCAMYDMNSYMTHTIYYV